MSLGVSHESEDSYGEFSDPQSDREPLLPVVQVKGKAKDPQVRELLPIIGGQPGGRNTAAAATSNGSSRTTRMATGTGDVMVGVASRVEHGELSCLSDIVQAQERGGGGEGEEGRSRCMCSLK
jgi:hypothetical protein